MIHSYYSTPYVREICHDVKQTKNTYRRQKAIRYIADDLISRNIVSAGDVLIPAPQHGGRAEYTLEIAKQLSKVSGASVADVLRRIPSKSLYEKKYEGKPVDPEMYIEGSIPFAERYFFVDNVISTGTTYKIACMLCGLKLKPLVFAIDETKESVPES